MTDQEIRLQFGEMNPGEMRLARALVAWHERELAKLKDALPERPHADEIAELKADLIHAKNAVEDLMKQRDKAHAELNKWEADALRYCKNADFWRSELDKAQGILKACLSVMPFGNIETHTVENLPGRIADLASEISSLSLENERLEAEIAKWHAELSAVMPADFKDWHENAQAEWPAVAAQVIRNLQAREESALGMEKKAQAVAAVVEARMIRRMEVVPWRELDKAWDKASEKSLPQQSLEACFNAVRARLIAAAKGEGQAQEVPQAESETEKPAWVPHDGGPCPLKDEEVELVEVKWYGSEKPLIAALNCISGWTLEKGRSPKLNLITQYRVLKWKPGFGPEAKAGPAQPTTSPGWTPAVGDTVRLKSGGPAMTVTDVDPKALMCAWMNAQHELQVEPITTLCLTPATP